MLENAACPFRHDASQNRDLAIFLVGWQYFCLSGMVGRYYMRSIIVEFCPPCSRIIRSYIRSLAKPRLPPRADLLTRRGSARYI